MKDALIILLLLLMAIGYFAASGAAFFIVIWILRGEDIAVTASWFGSQHFLGGGVMGIAALPFMLWLSMDKQE